MIKNAIIGFLSMGLLFTNTIYGEYGFLAYLAMSMLTFSALCVIEYKWEKHMEQVRQLKRFKEDVKREITPQPTKADRVI